MTREELIEIIENEVYIEDNYGSYLGIGGVNNAADAILAKLEQEQKAKDYNPEAILKILGITR